MRKNTQPRLLIVNADDANLTQGVNQAILEAHEQGLVTSTTFLINLPLESKTVRRFLKAGRLGLGLHLNISLGAPVSRFGQVLSLVSQRDFRKKASLLEDLPLASEVSLEYENQVRLFRKKFGRMPTHLDTHHQLHDHPFYLRVLIQTAKRFRLPVRRSGLWSSPKTKLPVCSSQRLLGDLRPQHYWRKKNLLSALTKLPGGVTEVMCHPGIVNPDLKAVTSFTEGRFKEFQVFRSPELRKWAAAQGIRLTHYGMWYTW